MCALQILCKFLILFPRSFHDLKLFYFNTNYQTNPIINEWNKVTQKERHLFEILFKITRFAAFQKIRNIEVREQFPLGDRFSELLFIVALPGPTGGRFSESFLRSKEKSLWICWLPLYAIYFEFYSMIAICIWSFIQKQFARVWIRKI